MNEYLAHKIDAVERLLLGNSLWDWLLAGIVGLAVWSALWIVRRLVASRYQKYSAAQQRLPIRLIAYLAGNTRQFLFFAIALYAAQTSLTLPDKVQHIVRNAVLILILVQIGLWAGRSVRFYLESKQKERGADQVFAGSLDIINFVARMLIWSLVILVALDNLGVNITALLAGLGVGGVAVALALQSVLVDLFASLSIALDKPFGVGDNLVVDTFTGTVEHIGIKSTRLRSESGEQIIIANADMLKSRLRNFSRAPEQRALATIRVAYGTPAEKLRSIPAMLEAIVREQANARFDRCHLKTLGESSLHFELSYFVQQPSIHPLLDLQQAVNFRIIDELQRLGVEFAYPAQLVLLEDRRAPPADEELRGSGAMFHVVLFEPEIPPNTGNVIRLCANTGAVLHLVKPLGFRLDDRSLRRSGLDYHDLASVKVHQCLDACLTDLGGARLFAVETGGRHRYSDQKYREGDAFLFGPETRGLPEAVLSRAGREFSVFIPMRAQSRSINLSNAVALIAYEAWRQIGFAGSWTP